MASAKSHSACGVSSTPTPRTCVSTPSTTRSMASPNQTLTCAVPACAAAAAQPGVVSDVGPARCQTA
eukprot:8872684-Pyramimonas_sp.AAC.1